MNNRPPSMPKCKHGKVPGVMYDCPGCLKERKEIRAFVKPLVDEFWQHRGQRDLAHLMLRAYKMGMEHDIEDEDT